MIDLAAFADRAAIREPECSLTEQLEVRAGGYLVIDEGLGRSEPCWLAVYRFAEGASGAQEQVAYVSSDYRWAFVLTDCRNVFELDAEGRIANCISVDSFREERLCCSAPVAMAGIFSRVVWIDDDFLTDDTIPFDDESFALIESGVDFLNPKHFSVMQMVRATAGFRNE